ncbi:MAG: transposase-like protein [Bradymonadia bacterium]|jgi:transposase-like protein
MSTKKKTRAPRRKSSPEFRADAVGLTTTRGANIAQAARDLGLGDKVLRSWIKAHREQDAGGLSSDERAELAQHRRDNRRLTAELKVVKIDGLLCEGVSVAIRFRFILAEEANHRISLMCRIVHVSRSGCYDWLRERSMAAATRHAEFDRLVKEAFDTSHQRYGSRRIQLEVEEARIACSRSRVAASIRRSGFRPNERRRFKATTDSNH